MKKVKFKLRNFLHMYLYTKINKKMLDFVCVYACTQVEVFNSFNLGPSRASYPVNRVKCEKVKAKCSFSMGHRDLHKLRPSKEYIDVFIYPSLMI